MERYRTTIILLAVLLIVGGAALFLNSTGGVGVATPTPPTVAPSVYVWQDTNPVIGLDVVSGTQKVSMIQDVSSTQWTLTQPVAERADDTTIQSEASVLSPLLATSAVTNTSDLAPFGLDKPPLTVTVTFSDTAHTKRILQVGNTTFDGSGYYVKQPSAPSVYIVTNTAIEPLRTWLSTPPVFVPSPTPTPTETTAPATVTGTVGITSTVGMTGTETVLPGTSVVNGTPASSAGTTTPTASQTGSVPVTPIGASSTITTTLPSGANPTTPEVTPILPAVTSTP